MIRIISGKYKGRYLLVPPCKVTRPTMDKVRQAIFSALKDKCINSISLDLFAGSGAYGIETISRGGKKSYLNEKDKSTFSVIVKNVNQLNDLKDTFNLTCLDYRLFLKKFKDIKFDLVFLDPPYRFKINDSIIEYLVLNNMLNESAVIISEQDFKNKDISYFRLKEYNYGRKYVGLYYYLGKNDEK